MSDNRTHDDIRDLVAVYVLGALPEDEMKLVRDHLLTCESCRAQADDLAPAASALALAAEPVTPPPGFADRVVARATEGRAAPQPRRRFSLGHALGYAALVLVTAVFAIGFFAERGRNDSTETALAQVLEGTDGLELEGRPGATVELVPGDEGALLVALGMEPLDPEKTYELWVMEGDCADPASEECAITSAGTFEAADGIGILRTDVPLERFDRAAISVEREGGSPTGAPQTTPILISA